MIRKMLIANRGEIAVRVIRACREMGIETVAVYSTADKECLHVQLADHAVCIGPPPSSKSYLNKDTLITAALCTGCDAVHPGVGFLSENADFAREVEKAGMFWIGPKPDTIEMLGDKVRARETAQKSGLPITPGSKGAITTKEQAAKTAKECGYPVIIKAASGGGGKGMRIVWKEVDLAENLSIASSEAEANFADGTVYIEKYLSDPRHVELQVIGDGAGGVAILGERDCSVQRNHQKLIEESPSQAVSDTMYETMCKGAKKLFSTLKYCGAGTIEFLVSGDQFYFMEVNARVQVEHPVSEMVTGTDIIREQITVCTGGKMTLPDGVVPVNGWAIEARINARTPGLITNLRVPGGNGVRFDGFLYQGYKVVPFYDSMTAKLIVHGADRAQAIQKLLCALDELHIEGIQTNIEEQKTILRSAQFQSGSFGTSLYAQLFTSEDK
ncbi:acetyl-CoA carboxylase biotin carboxylase subunit [Treponema sp. OMZ 305]|uniref:acetyl-CoA carboxylase biotin carboxylase subunit n=1 Tax=Treponema TaxID=157 RepID=UPI001BAF0E6B|nr:MULTISPECIES: acetyl-CoA carboxylase biotin carboxylase subunit [Treponema]QUY17536.1 acetyl-CoA carboxylase biotin carboxylase subunit [Treponema vincentii]UTC57405.1 acetyl-CoA carboxylase biotin carboxylase subunit [Treponema sp. OMZ 305]